MPNFTFKCEHQNFISSNVESTNVHECHAESLHEVLENFERFLKGSGFVFDGVLDIVNEEESEEPIYDRDYQSFDCMDFNAGAAAPTLSVSSDEHESTAWPFPQNKRPDSVPPSNNMDDDNEEVLHIRV